MNNCNKGFTRKNGTQKGGKLYKWCPDTSNKKNASKVNQTSGGKKYFCIAPIGSKGNDFKTTYSYVIVLINGQAEREAYVQCDYVK